MRPTIPVSLFAACLFAASARAEPLVLEGEVPDDGDSFLIVPFQVPEGIAELEYRHDDLSAANILDWGLEDPHGFRGWGGGNTEPAVLNAQAATRSYLPGPIVPGEWKVVIGKAKIVEKPARYRVEIELRTATTLPPQERSPWTPPPALKKEARWYAGDLHVHSRESGDAHATFDEIAELARSRGLDFVALSEHNTVSHLGLLPAAQAKHPELLLVPSVEFTTYDGHANAFGATEYVDHRIGLNGVSIEGAMNAFAAQGAIFSINHPVLDLGDACIGCAWKHPTPAAMIGAVEIATGGWKQTGFIFGYDAIAFWDRLCARGHHVVAVGGSDDHRAGSESSSSPVGDPTTMIFARELSVEALIQGIREGRTVVKLQGPDDPMVTLDGEGRRELDTLVGERTTLTVMVTGGVGHQVRLVQNGQPLAPVAITSDPFVLEHEAVAPERGEARWRAEVLVGGDPRTVTSHVWHSRSWAGDSPESSGCGCTAAAGAAAWPALFAVLLLVRRRR